MKRWQEAEDRKVFYKLLLTRAKNWNITATIQIGYDFQIQKRIDSMVTLWGNDGMNKLR